MKIVSPTQHEGMKDYNPRVFSFKFPWILYTEDTASGRGSRELFRVALNSTLILLVLSSLLRHFSLKGTPNLASYFSLIPLIPSQIHCVFLAPSAL